VGRSPFAIPLVGVMLLQAHATLRRPQLGPVVQQSIALFLSLGAAEPPADTSSIDVRAAAAVVLDSGAVWAGEVVGSASRVVVDRSSFERIAKAATVRVARSSAALTGSWEGAVDLAFDSVKTCVGTIQPRCTLPEGTVVVQAKSAKVSGERTTMTIALRWPRRGLMGFVEYDVTFVKGAIESVRQVRRS
jgi:hypothetical protein